MRYFKIEPEVAGGLGQNTKMDRSVHPPIVSKLHYELDGWPDDVILESFPSFIVTEETKQVLLQAGVTGAQFDEVEITTSGQFRDLYPDRLLPNFVWLKIEGMAGQDDFGTTSNGMLTVSERALGLLNRLGISNALVTPFEN